METLLDYAAAEFPHHTAEVWADHARTPAELQLTDHTVVAHVIGDAEARQLVRALHDAGWGRVAAVQVHPTPTTVAKQPREDEQGITDLPNRRIAAAAAAGAVVGLAVLGVGAGLITGSFVAGIIVACFGAVLGAVIGAMVGGLGRHAGERAWAQPNVPGREITVVAVFADDDAAAARAATSMESAGPHEVRVVNGSGGWRAPNT